jgi:hypothetical protein
VLAGTQGGIKDHRLKESSATAAATLRRQSTAPQVIGMPLLSNRETGETPSAMTHLGSEPHVEHRLPELSD